MIILLEGVDKVGKTTFAQHLAQDMDIPVHRFTVPPEGEHAAYHYFRDQLNTFLKTEPHFILDRFHLSNRAYNGMLGGGVLTQDEWIAFDETLASRNTWLILMVDNPRDIPKRLQADEREGVQRLSSAEVGELQNRFTEQYHVSRIPHKASFRYPQMFDPSLPFGVTPQYRQVVKAMNGSLDMEAMYAELLAR